MTCCNCQHELWTLTGRNDADALIRAPTQDMRGTTLDLIGSVQRTRCLAVYTCKSRYLDILVISDRGGFDDESVRQIGV